MTWADGIALAVGLTTLALLLTHQHRSTTAQPHPIRRTENGHEPHQRAGEEDGHHPQDGSSEEGCPGAP